MVRKALGKGLDALIPDMKPSVEVEEKQVINLSITDIKRNRYQPRAIFDDQKLKELTESIKQNGIIQPIIVRRLKDGFELIAGERRVRAARKAGHTTVPALVIDAEEEDVLALALVENIQRDDLNPLEHARAFKLLTNEFKMTQEQIAEKIGKDRTTITNYLRILSLPKKVKDLIAMGKLSFGHARALLSLDNSKAQQIIATDVVKKALSVRECEKLVARKKSSKAELKTAAKGKDPYLLILENRLQQILGTRVKIVSRIKGGKIEIEYYSDDDLDRILIFFNLEQV